MGLDDLPQAIIDKIAPMPDGCWYWTGSLSGNGYGQIASGYRRLHPSTAGSSPLAAHRFIWTHLRGSIPAGLELDHLCRTIICVNPAHLELVTHSENVRRGRVGSNHRDKTHCPEGHAYDEANTYVHNGKRNCRACRRRSERAYRARRRNEAA